MVIHSASIAPDGLQEEMIIGSEIKCRNVSKEMLPVT